MIKERVAEIRAGLFTMILLIVFAAMVFIIGSHKGYFKPQITLRARFMHVYGLQVGAPVRFMGVGIGHVKAVVLPANLPCTGIDVLLLVDKSVQKFLTGDSIATIKWLSYVTGDSYVEIESGECRGPMVQDGGLIKSTEPINYTAAIESGIGTIESLSKIFKKLEEGNFVESLSNVSKSLNESVEAFQKGGGLLHSLIYDPKGKQLMENLVATSESLKGIMTEVEKGEGTLGALIADPTVYDNLKNLLGGADRSFILRSLIRKSIEKGKGEK